MTRTTVIADRRLYTISPLERRAAGQVFQAIVVVQLVDDLTGAPLRATTRVATSFGGLRQRSAADGFAGLVGTPSRALPALDTEAYKIDLAIAAEGYATRHETAAFAIQAGFPDSFEAAELGVLLMRRTPIVIEVGTYEYDPTDRPLPLPAADVTISGHWRSVDGLGDPASTNPLLAVAGGLSAARPAGSSIDLPPLATPAEPSRTLVGPSSAGTTRLAVSTAGSLTAGDLVGIELSTPERAERIEVLAVEGPSDLESPCEVVLRFPALHEHPQDTSVQRITVSPAPPSPVQIGEQALEGDRTLFVTSLAGVSPGQVVRISGGVAGPEYRVVDQYDVTTDAEGFGRFPAITGLAAVELTAVSGALGATALVTLTNRTPTHGLDLTLT
jgi:hypothetical protein